MTPPPDSPVGNEELPLLLHLIILDEDCQQYTGPLPSVPSSIMNEIPAETSFVLFLPHYTLLNNEFQHPEMARVREA